MNEISKLQGASREERRKIQELNALLQAKDDVIKELRVRDSVLRKHQERAQKMKEERDSLSKELKQCRDENYELAMSYARQSEEKNVALMKNRDLQLEVGCCSLVGGGGGSGSMCGWSRERCVKVGP